MDGIGQFTFQAFKKIVVNHPEVEFHFIFDHEPGSSFIFAKNIVPVKLFPPTKRPFLYKLFFNISVKKYLAKNNIDLFIGTDGIIPQSTSSKTLSIIHDLNFEHHPEQLPKSYRNYYCKYFPLFAQKATRIATVSEYSKKDIEATYSIPENKIDVVYNGANDNFTPVEESVKTEIKSKFTDNKNFFLFVGTLHPRKNLIRLFKAFDEFKKTTSSDFKLLIVGKKMWWTNEIEAVFNSLSHKNDIVFAGRVSETELYQITASAYALTYVPIFEGFGIPLVEAMSCKVPVITSNVTSMPEVVEDAGLLVDPFSEKDICNAMVQLASDKDLHSSLSNKGFDQAQKFSWDKTAKLLWSSIEKTMNA